MSYMGNERFMVEEDSVKAPPKKTVNKYSFHELQRRHDNLNIRFNGNADTIARIDDPKRILELSDEMKKLKEEIRDIEVAVVHTEYEL